MPKITFARRATLRMPHADRRYSSTAPRQALGFDTGNPVSDFFETLKQSFSDAGAAIQAGVNKPLSQTLTAGASGGAGGVSSGGVIPDSALPPAHSPVRPLSQSLKLVDLINYSRAGFHAANKQRKFKSAALYYNANVMAGVSNVNPTAVYQALVAADATNKAESSSGGSGGSLPAPPALSQGGPGGSQADGRYQQQQQQQPGPDITTTGGGPQHAGFLSGISPGVMIAVGGGLLVLLILTAPKKSPPASPSPAV